MDADRRTMLDAFVGARIAGFEQADEEPAYPGQWRDDPPLVIRFEDGRALQVSAAGWHDSGGLRLMVARGLTARLRTLRDEYRRIARVEAEAKFLVEELRRRRDGERPRQADLNYLRAALEEVDPLG